MQNFYKWKTVLITWSTWFKWSWLSYRLNKLWANVIWYWLEPNTNPNVFSVLNLDNKITQIFWDISDYKRLEEVAEQYKPEIIFHLAAQPIVRESYDNPVYTMNTNVMWTVNIMELIRTKECIKWWVIITTDKVYENKEWLWPYRENDRLWWFDPYSSSKAMAELAVESYRKSFLQKTDKKICAVRAWNVIWWWDWAKDRLIPDIIRSLQNNENVVLRNPNAVRPWQYVLDALHWYLIAWMKMFEDDKYQGAYNFWPDITDTLKVIDIVKQSIEILWKWWYEIRPEMNQWKHEAWLLLLDNTKSKTFLWRNPKYNVHDVLIRTLNFYKEYYEWKNMEEYANKEIENYM